MKLVGRHVTVRDVEPADLEALRRIELADENWRFRGTTPGPDTYARSVFDGVVATGTVVLNPPESTSARTGNRSKPIGLVAAYGADQRNGHCYASTIVESAFQSTGFGMEALGLLLDHVFGSFPMRKVYFETTELHLGTWADAAERLLELEGRFRDHEYIAGAYRDRIVYSLRREAWSDLRDLYLGAFADANANDPPDSTTNIETELSRCARQDTTLLDDQVELAQAGLDSLNLLECVVRLEDIIGDVVPEPILADMRTIGDLRSLWRTRLANSARR